ncbi:conserved hypothetical protein [Gloeothece citriformis PCC 7424]|uniref:DUF2079 domain-containing protein n=1 Tax=Gloeothece citriformis (strain PCC 7424) TaxID=65393 RepID=B7KDP5_GLOC7|nr:DUF2079 domain-containing protein [Gloeothece citriformis]ACK70347.1 conserved hypothetical protein [Gloeothece citriformis PCC 7424]
MKTLPKLDPKKYLVPSSLGKIIALTSLILFISSSVRHILFQSNALDLGWFDQAVYLISQGKPPIVSFVDFHILGDHAAFLFYPIALFYKIYPSVYWLFIIQAIALALGAIPVWQLAIHSGLKNNQATALAIVYLLYPLIFNINLFDFHLDVIAVPAILWGVLAARLGYVGWFCVAIVIILGCKAILSLTVVAMGLWLLIGEKNRICGTIAIVTGIAWFMIATQIIIPFFTGTDAAVQMADERYSYLGDSLGEIALNLFLKPQLVLSKLFTLANLEYLILLFIPLIWGLYPRYLTPLIAAIPPLGLNLITDYTAQKNLTHQYSLPILPFLILAVIASLSHGKGWIKKPKWMIVWSIVGFLALAKYGYFSSLYLKSLDTWQATREAIALVNTKGGVLTTSPIAPHLTHRPLIKLAIAGSESINLNQFDYILLNKRHPGWSSSPELVSNFIDQVQQNPDFKLTYERDEIFLFKKSQQ